MEFMIQPIDLPSELPQQQPGPVNWVCPPNVYQCGCKTVAG